MICKFVFGNSYLNSEKITKLSKIVREVKPDFTKISAGFVPSGTIFEDVKIMKEIVGGAVKVKAASGIRDFKIFMKMVLDV